MTRTWQAALDTLYGLANWETRGPNAAHAFELDRMRALLSALGDPQVAWPAVHVGGTNGKGTVAALVDAVLRHSGLRVGRYTSPHLHTVRERIQVDGAPIAEAEVMAWLAARADALGSAVGLTTFEALTALAFDHFAARGVDVAVVEVGLGGRLDSTNVLAPAVTVLTPIGLDHMAVLGDTPAAIARDKAGILRPGVPVVLAPQRADVAGVIEAAARAAGCPLVRVGRDVRWSERAPCGGGPVVVERAGGRPQLAVRPALAGPYHAQNTAVAVAVCDVLAEAGWELDDGDLRRGMASARWPGRFERLGDGPVLVLDGAHNVPAATALRRALAACHPGAARHLVIGTSRDKDVAALARALGGPFETIRAVRATHPRAMPAEEVAARLAAAGLAARASASPAHALDAALAGAAPTDVVVATGSLFAMAEVREAWAALGHMPMPPRDPPVSGGRDVARRAP